MQRFKIIIIINVQKINNYKIICYTNFDIHNIISKIENIEYREYYDNSKYNLYKDRWLNMSFNKINIYKDLYDEYKKDYIWIDLDTIICYDITYINDLSNVFIENGGISEKDNIIFSNNKSYNVPRNKYIQ